MPCVASKIEYDRYYNDQISFCNLETLASKSLLDNKSISNQIWLKMCVSAKVAPKL